MQIVCNNRPLSGTLRAHVAVHYRSLHATLRKLSDQRKVQEHKAAELFAETSAQFDKLAETFPIVADARQSFVNAKEFVEAEWEAGLADLQEVPEPIQEPIDADTETIEI